MLNIKKVFDIINTYYKGYRIHLLFILLITSFLSLSFPWIFRIFVDVILVKKDIESLWTVVMGIFFLFLLRAFLNSYQNYKISYLGEKVVEKLRLRLCKKALTMPIRFFDKNNSGELISRMSNDINILKVGITFSLIELIRQFIILIFGIFIIFLINYKLAFLILASAPPIALMTKAMGVKIRENSKRTQEKIAKLLGFLNEIIGGIKSIKSLGLEEFFYQKFLANNNIAINAAIKTLKISNLTSLTFEIWVALSIFIIATIGSWQVIKGVISPGDLIALFLYGSIIRGPLTGISFSFSQFQQSLGAADRIEELLSDKKGEEKSIFNSNIKIEYVKGVVEFRNVYFSYGNDFMLEDINLILEPGNITAIVGPNGSGKSTIAYLINKFYNPCKGGIFIDNININALSPNLLHELIGYSPQEPFLFEGTIRENIALGKINATDEEIILASKMANAHSWVVKLEKGYDTFVGERGCLLSSGQQEMLSLARIFLKNPTILILDEATSSIDLESERLIHETLLFLKRKNKTILVITHKFTFIEDFDNIYVFNKGKIVSEGKHEELLRKCLVYRRLYFSQFNQRKEINNEIKN